jgi:lysophospholipase L1-like esterase
MPDPVTIVALGDSTTAGTPLFLSPVESPPEGSGEVESQFTYWLMRAHPDWRVLNCGVNGERTDQIAARFDRDVLAHDPRVVIILAGVNDVYQGHAPADITGRLREMYDRAARSAIPVVAGSIIPYNTATPAQNAAMHAVNRHRGRARSECRLRRYAPRRGLAAEHRQAALLHRRPAPER